MQPLKVSEVNNLVTASEFLKTQENDNALNSIRKHISNKTVFQRKGRVSTFITRNRRMYRVTEYKGVVKEQSSNFIFLARNGCTGAEVVTFV